MVSAPIPVSEIPKWMKVLTPYFESVAINYDGDSVSDLEQMLMGQVATLHLFDDKGFAILQWLPGECHVRLAHSFSTRPTNLKGFFGELVEYAKQFNCSKITFSSSRKAVGRFAKSVGMRVEMITYAKEI